MCAGLIADQTLLRNGLLVVLGSFVTRFAVGIARPFRSVRQMVVVLLGPIGRATRERLPINSSTTLSKPP
jgi:hypothetical protein